VARPMFFYAGVYDSSADAELDHAAIRALRTRRAIGAYESTIVVLEPGTTALVVVGGDSDAEAVELVAERAKEHTLERTLGDRDKMERKALDWIARAVRHAEV
jgi:hypothetical protein